MLSLARRISAHISSRPRSYIHLQKLIGADRLRRLCLQRFVQLRPGERVLDLGCGPGYILEFMPEVDYVGFDTDTGYIAYARKTYGERGTFHCETFGREHLAQFAPFDTVLLFGILHHLDDRSAIELMQLVAKALKPEGRAVTLDPCFVPGQGKISRFIAESDRGAFVRDAVGYDALALRGFRAIDAQVYRNVCRIPSIERVMLLTQPIPPEWLSTESRR